MFFMIGGGLGAAVALLFAPKPGRELRQDIADTVRTSYDETLDAANRVKERSLEYLSVAEEKGAEMIDALVNKATAVRDEIAEDAEKWANLCPELQSASPKP